MTTHLAVTTVVVVRKKVVRDESGAATLGELLTRGAAGDQQAWAELTERLMPAIWGVVRSFGLSRDQSEDLSQTVWLRLIDRHDTIRDPERVAGWVLSTARNEALAMIRKGNREQPTEVLDLTESTHAQPGDRLEVEDTHRLLREAFEQLGEQCRALLRLLASKVPYADVAIHLDMPVGSIGPTRQRCLKRLRATSAGKQVREGA